MKIMPSWDAFRYKYPSAELQRARFEDLSRAIFCHRFNLKYGIFQYYNHAGNETDTIVDNGQVIGFQAKYFDTTINPNVINESIQKAHSLHPEQTKIIIYTNLSFGNPPRGENSTAAQKKVGDYAASVGLEIEWATDNMILDQAARIDWIYDTFFGTEPNLYTLVKEEDENTKAHLNPISSDISYNGVDYKVDRSKQLNHLIEGIRAGKHFVIHGEGGIGKTALIKDLYNYSLGRFPVCIRKAEFFKGISFSDVFKQVNSYSAEQFLSAFDSEKKVFVIDSSERLQEFDNDDVIRYTLNCLIENGWSIIFTVRNVYLNELRNNLNFSYKIQAEFVTIDNVEIEELSKMGAKFRVKLPSDDVFKSRLTNLFYFDLYVRYNGQEFSEGTYQAFRDRIWKEKIAGGRTTGGISLKRENCFKSIIRERANSDRFYANQELFDAEALQKLIDDEIVSICPKGVFIAHDIYEEWGIDKIIESTWIQRESITGFFSSLGTSYLIRRVFRLWLTRKIDNNVDGISEFLDTAQDDSIDPLWQDEVIVSMLNSSLSSKYMQDNSSILLEGKADYLNRMVFLLQLACKRYDKTISIEGVDYHIYVPCGPGWNSVIEFLYTHLDKTDEVKYVTNALSDWTNNNKQGQATRYCGLIALHFWTTTETGQHHRLNDNYANTLSQIICNSAHEIKVELASLIAKIIRNRWFKYKDPYYEFSQFILTQPSHSLPLIAAIPENVIQLADAFWTDSDEQDIDMWQRDYDFNHNRKFGIRESDYRRGYSPASASQSPMYQLLCFKPKEALDFFIDFTNRCVQHYQKESKVQDSLEKLCIHLPNGENVEYLSNLSLWGSYRGAIHGIVPDLFQSIHMALEKYLLNLANAGKHDFVRCVFDKILNKSISISTTAIISSLICAYPDKYWRHALVLFRTPELFHYDRQRCTDESLQKTFYGMSAYRDIDCAKERMSTLEQGFRSRNLESLCTEYQYVHYEGMTEEEMREVSHEIAKIFDDLFEYADTLQEDERNTLKILLYRMDRRKHQPKVTKIEGKGVQIELNPNLPDDVKEYSEECTTAFAKPFRFLALFNWAIDKATNGKSKSINPQYDQNPRLVIDGIRDTISAIEAKEPLMPMDGYIPYLAAAELLIHHSDSLNKTDVDFCACLVERIIQSSFSDYYSPQMHDGLESSIHALPILIAKKPENAKIYQRYIVKTLMNIADLGAYKRVCDYALETISTLKLCEDSPSLLRAIVLDYAVSALQIDSIVSAEIKKGSVYQGPYGTAKYSRSAVLKSIDNSLDSQKQFDIETIRIENLQTERAEILLELLSSIGVNEYNTSIIKRLTSNFAGTLCRRYDSHLNYDRPMQLYRAFAHYVLSCSEDEIADLILPFKENIDGDDNSKYFLEAFVIEQNSIPKTDQFWTVWKSLYDVVLSPKFFLSRNFVCSYMLASYTLCEYGPWEHLRPSDLWLYSNISKDKGESPHVLFAISKALNYYASAYVSEGIDWLYEITSKYPNLALGDNEANTIFYMERMLDKYIRESRAHIKTTPLLKKKVINILTFMVKRNSTQGYMLREYIA